MRYLAAVLCVAMAAAVAGAAERAETVEANVLEGAIESISAQQVQVKLAQGSQAIPLADVSSLELLTADSLLAQAGATVITTRAGDTLGASGLKVADGKASFDSRLGKVTCDVTTLSAIYFSPAGQLPQAVMQQARDVAAGAESADTVIVDQGKEWTGVEGVLVSVGDQKVTLRYEGEDRLIDRKNIRAIRIATAGATPAGAKGKLTLTDGSEVVFDSLTMAAEIFTAKTVALGEVQIPRKSVAAVRFISARVTELSTLKPEVEEAAFFDVKTPVGINKAAAGGPLKLAGKVYASGVGASSFTKLDYAVDGKFKMFVAVLGIDDAARPLGNAAVTFLGDEKELAKPFLITGKDAPLDVRLDLTGVKKLTIRIDFGPDNLPVGDQVDIASARLIK